MKAMILAAGLGTRLRPYSLLRPKPLFPVLGDPLLLRIIRQLREAGFGPIIVNAYHLADQIASCLDNQADIILQLEPMELGTGGGLRMALRHFDAEPVLITNGDIYHDIDYGAVYARHQASGYPLTMVMHDYPRFNKVRVDQGLVRSFSSNAPAGHSVGETLAFTGIHVLQPHVLEAIPTGLFYSIIDRYQGHLDSHGLIRADVVTGCFWQDIGTVDDYLDLHHTLLSDSTPRFRLADGVTIGQEVTLEGWGYIGAGATIGDGACLNRVVVWDGAVIPKGAAFRDCLVTS
jgi:mannose-1-phosphate guanylyltransferase